MIIVFCVSAAFGLGRLSALTEIRPDVVFKSVPVETNLANTAAARESEVVPDESASGSGTVVASKNGTKYHYPWCSGAKSIAEQNKIVFNSIEEARAAGYTPASNCKGLK